MARRFGWGSNGGTTLGDVAAALASASFGDGNVAAVALTTNAAGHAPDLSLGENFYYTVGLVTAVTNGSATKFTTPTNYGEGSKVRLIVKIGAHSIGAITFGAIYLNAPVTGTKLAVTAYKVFEFAYSGALGKFVQTNAGRSAAGNIVA